MERKYLARLKNEEEMKTINKGWGTPGQFVDSERSERKSTLILYFSLRQKNPHNVVVKKLECLRFGNIKTVPPHGRAGGGLALL